MNQEEEGLFTCNINLYFDQQLMGLRKQFFDFRQNMETEHLIF